MITREEAERYRAAPYHVKPVRWLPTERELELAETIVELYDELDRIKGHVGDIEYTYNHWHDTAKVEIGSALFHIRFGPNPKEA
jgi:hypothetical protein